MAFLSVSVKDNATPAMMAFIAGLRSRTRLHRMMANRVQNTIRNHLLGLATSRHDTAKRLGAAPTGFLGNAAEVVGKTSAVKSDESGGTITLKHPGMRRAFEDVPIAPKDGKKFLTIPNVAEAYGNRYYSVLRKYGVKSKRTGKLVLPKRPDGKRWFILVPSVLQKQDRTLLPTDADMRNAARQGVMDYWQMLKERGAAKNG